MPLAHYARPENVLMREVGDESLLLNTETESYFSLNAVGTLLYQLLEGGSSFNDALNKLEASFEIDRDTLQKDCERILDELQESGLIQPDT